MEVESLEQKALRQFDALVKRGNLLWRKTTPQMIPCQPFNFQFRAATSLTAKPILKSNDPGRTKATNPFSDDDPDFHLDDVGTEHSLILNKFCVVRPQYILHTNDFVPQSDPLTERDLRCAWDVLQRLESRHLVIYNCGFEAGSSLGHKHLQILPTPPRDEFDFFPNTLGINEETCTVPKVPFRHAVKRLPLSPSSSDLTEIYEELLKRARVDHAAGHNVLLVKEWMLVIPRSRGRKGILSANSAAMAGMVWVTGEEEIKLWKEEGLMNLLCEFGVMEEKY